MTRAWEPYLHASSAVHRLDPRLKLLCTVGTVLAASLVPSGEWAPLLALTGLLAGIVALSRLPLRPLLARTSLALPFVLLAALSVPFARPGLAVWSARVGPLTLTLTREGLLAMGGILARAWLSLWAATLLVATTPVPALQHAL
ncbi:MAG: CbiQ family ECF transporter T component, partial [Anaerolineae bacterium]